LELQNLTACQEKHQLLKEKHQLEVNNQSLLSEKEQLVREKELIVQEKQQLDEQIEALSLDKIWSCSFNYVKKLEDCMANDVRINC
jgi:hypothetical protein